MELREALAYISEAGYPIAAIAKRIGKDPSTITKWMRGTSPYLSAKTQQDIWHEIARIRECFVKIKIKED